MRSGNTMLVYTFICARRQNKNVKQSVTAGLQEIHAACWTRVENKR